MKTSSILVLLAAQLSCVSVQAFWSIDFYQTDENPFSEEFTTNYESALKESQASNSLASFSDMLTKFKKPQEQAEVEITMGFEYCNHYPLSDGDADDCKAIEHFGKALLHDLPPTVLVDVYLERGGCKGRLKEKQAALEDCLRGLAECLRYQLPTNQPERHTPSVVYDVVFFEPGNDADKEHYSQLEEDQVRDDKQYRFEEVMVGYRNSLIEEAKQFSGGDAEQIRLAAEAAVNDKSKIPPLVALLTTPDPKPFP